MSTIYIVEDDENIRELVTYALKSNGYEAVGFQRASTFWQAMQAKSCDLILLDIMLPQESGLEVLKKLKQNDWKQIPVILVTAKTMEFDKIQGLDSGADDYITKPFSILELVSRVKAVLRRCSVKEPDEILLFRTMQLDMKKRTVTVNGVLCNLTFKEFELLHYFMKNINVVLSREKIMEVVWGFDFEGESRTVDMHVKSLREKLGIADWIHTIRSVGYKLGD